MGAKRIEISDDMKADITARRLTDLAIAEKYGISRGTVAKARVRLAVASAHQSVTIPLDEEHLLGTLPDPVLAERWGTTRANIARYRASRGVVAWRKKKSQDLEQGLERAQPL